MDAAVVLVFDVCCGDGVTTPVHNFLGIACCLVAFVGFVTVTAGHASSHIHTAAVSGPSVWLAFQQH
jgi:hypothetical protein